MATIDRESPTNRLGKERNRSSRIIVFTVALVTALMIGAFPELIGHSDEGPASVRVLALTPHDPILIDGNDGFTNASGVVWGNGTLSDPYIVEEWDINASVADGISIRNSSAYFIVRACYFHDGRSNNNFGIRLNNCTNGVLDNNTCSNNSEGIYLDISSGIAILGNTCSSNNGSGVSLFWSSNNVLAGNSCSGNAVGIGLHESNHNALSNNNCSNNWGGMSVLLSSNNDLSGNNCSANNNVGITITGSNNALNENSCSYNNDGILVWQTTDNILRNNSCSNNNIGIRLEFAHSNTLVNNSCSNNLYGIRLGEMTNFSASNSNTIVWNLLCNNTYHGVSIDKGSFNKIWNNTFTGNNGAGSTYDPAHIQASDNGTDNWWNSTEEHGNYWSDWTTPDLNGDYVVDLPYNITGSAGAKDYYPLTTTPAEPIPEFGMAPFVVMVFLAVIVLTGELRRRRAS